MGLRFGRLPALGLPVDQSAHDLHHRRVDRVGTTKPRRQDRPIFRPADDVFYSDTDRPQPSVKHLLLDRQLAPARFLERSLHAQARDPLFDARLRIAQANARHLVRQTLVALVRIHFTSGRQPRQRLHRIAQLLVRLGEFAEANWWWIWINGLWWFPAISMN